MERIDEIIIKWKVENDKPLTERERAGYLLFIASWDEAKKFIEKEKKYGRKIFYG